MTEISDMQAAQVPQVAALERRCFSMPWSERSIRGELDNPWAIWLVAREDGALAGYLGVQYGPDGGDILTIATDPACRGRGVGKQLLTSMRTRLETLERRWLTLEVRPSNTPALGLYAAMGFRPVGRRPRYYRDPTEDALLLTWFFEEDNDADSGN